MTISRLICLIPALIFSKALFASPFDLDDYCQIEKANKFFGTYKVVSDSYYDEDEYIKYFSEYTDIGHPGISASPLFLYYFLPRFLTYHLPIMDAVDISNNDVYDLIVKNKLVSFIIDKAVNNGGGENSFTYKIVNGENKLIRGKLIPADIFRATYAIIYGDELTQFDNANLDVKVKKLEDIPPFVRDWINEKNFNDRLIESGNFVP